MKRALYFLILLPILLLVAASSQALAYENPILKVLLVTAKQGVTLESPGGLEVNGAQQFWKRPKSLEVRYLGRGRVSLNGGPKQAKSLFVSSYDQVTLNLGGKRRHYRGMMEIKPFSGGFYLINHIPTEEYLEGVLNAEISTNWSMEAVKAQAVLARTYAIRKREVKKNQAWHLLADHRDQVYKGSGIADERGRYAIEQTRGMVISFNRRLAETFYHSNCGGWTEDPGNLWAYSLPYYSIKEVPFGRQDPKYHWQTLISKTELLRIAQRAGLSVKKLSSLSILERNESNRAHRLIFAGEREEIMEAKQFRALAGYSKIKSTLFEIHPAEGGYLFKGRGNGHGVGLCQWAAKEMAESGYKFHEIIHYFYDGIELASYRSPS